MLVEGGHLVCVHPIHKTLVYEMQIERLRFYYWLYRDHDHLEGLFGNVHVYDLTGYPRTVDPLTAPKGSLDEH